MNEQPIMEKNTKNSANARCLEAELYWLAEVIELRLKLHWGNKVDYSSPYQLRPPELANNNTAYARLVKAHKMGFSERLILILTLTPYLYPELLDTFFVTHPVYKRNCTEFGGRQGKQHKGFLPTAETAVFLLTDGLEDKLRLTRMFMGNHYFWKNNLLQRPLKTDEPVLSQLLLPSDELMSFALFGKSFDPQFSKEFPAQKLTTSLNWDDFVGTAGLLADLKMIKAWIKHHKEIMEGYGYGKKLKPGFRSLFYGPPGTGKTFAASLLSKETGLSVYRIDLSMIVSKYIGETEKNLKQLFDQAERRNWILFFDEADAIFGKRSTTSDAKDRYANQEVSYLLQRTEDYKGVIILASNFRNNIDAAFSRRFQSMIHFPFPDREQRLLLWQKSFEGGPFLDPGIDLDKIARTHKVTGAAIANVLRHCLLQAVQRIPHKIWETDIIDGIRREMRKEGKSGV